MPYRQAALCEQVFLSTSPLRGTTTDISAILAAINISIHVPLAGDDCTIPTCAPRMTNFYPRPPCGGRPSSVVPGGLVVGFLSTSPLRGTTGWVTSWRARSNISIHVPLAGDDDLEIDGHTLKITFLSTSPLRGTTTYISVEVPDPEHFYPRPPCGGRPKHR